MEKTKVNIRVIKDAIEPAKTIAESFGWTYAGEGQLGELINAIGLKTHILVRREDYENLIKVVDRLQGDRVE